MLRIIEEYISASCNVHARCCDLKASLLCFGSSNAVAVCDFKGVPSITHTVVGHKAQVNCVTWVVNSSGLPEYLVSCSADKTFVLWRMQAGRLVMLESIQAHTDSITYITATLTLTGCLIVVSTSVDTSTKAWCRDLEKDSAEFFLADELSTKGSLLMSLCSVQLADGGVLLACGAEDNKIHLYRSDQTHKFTWVHALKGHTDWVRDLAFDQGGDDGWLLASAGQDGYVRLWSVRCSGAEVGVELFSVLAAHEGWVQSVQWLQKRDNTRALLTSSLDHSVVLWTQDHHSLLWFEQERFGQGEAVMRGVVEEGIIIAHNYAGSFQVWRQNEMGFWIMMAGCGGHLGEVSDVCWNPQGEFLLSAGSDKTTRLHACVNGGKKKKDDAKSEMEGGDEKTENVSSDNGKGLKVKEVTSDSEENVTSTWCQISRPQIHGWKVNALTPLSRFTFASGADEKVVRLFQAPSIFMRTLASLTQAVVEDIIDTGIPTLPALALSNKVMAASEALHHHWKDGPPSEEWLRSALWLECEKLYGHNFDIFSLAACPSKCLLASASKASTSEAASILIWDTDTHTLLQRLHAHSSTVTQLSFSRHGDHLLSVSKDRTWSLFSLKERLFEKAGEGRSHTRVIWACSWSPDDLYFATASRDKKVMVWGKMEEGWQQATDAFSAQEAVTAVDFAPSMVEGRYLLVLGVESGKVVVLSWSPDQQQQTWSNIATLDHNSAHHKAVKRVCFRPVSEESACGLKFATCSEDGIVKVHSIRSS